MKSASRLAGERSLHGQDRAREIFKSNNLQEPSGLPNGSAKEFLTPNESSASNGSVRLNIMFTQGFACSCFWKDAQATFLRPLGG